MKISPLSSYSAKSGHLAFRGITYEPVKKTSYGYRYVEIFGVNMNDLFHWGSIKQERGIDYPFARNLQASIRFLF